MSPVAEVALITSLGGGAVLGVAATDPAPSWGALIVGAAALVTALTVLWKFLHLGEISRGMRHLVLAFNGQEERPGFDRVPGMPERMALIERHTHELKGAMPSVAIALEELQRWASDNGKQIDAVETKIEVVGSKVDHLDQRVTDHRRRNDEQAQILRTELDNRARDLERKLDNRNHEVDERLSSLSDDLLRAQTYRAALHELGIAIDTRTEPRDDGDKR